MTKKHFKAIAEIIKTNLKDAGDNEAMLKGIEYLANDLAEYFAQDNPKFDGIKFAEACGLPLMAE